jgi:hypothetical protein
MLAPPDVSENRSTIDNHVDGQLVGGVETLPDRLQIAMVADAGDAAADIEEGVGHLTDDHVDFI